MEFVLKNNIFDDEGHVRQKMEVFKITAAKEHIDSVKSKGITDINDYSNKCGIDKKRAIDRALDQFQILQ